MLMNFSVRVCRPNKVGITIVFLEYYVNSIVFSCKGGVTMFLLLFFGGTCAIPLIFVCLDTKMICISWYSLKCPDVACKTYSIKVPWYMFLLIQWFLFGYGKLSVQHGKPALICFEGQRRTLSCVSLEDLALIPSAKFHTIWTSVQLSGLIYRRPV